MLGFAALLMKTACGTSIRILLASVVCLSLALPISAQTYDIVIRGGRVLDPETNLDAVRDVGITSGKIARISETPLAGKHTIDARNLVVAPGFIDLHQHAWDATSQRLKAFDGVTTALELEIGAPDVTTFMHDREGRTLINYGSSASHPAAHAGALGSPVPTGEIIPKSGPATNNPATPEQRAAIESRLEHEIPAGALGIGMGLAYTPGATRSEVIQVFRIAARHHMPIFVHARSKGRIEPGSGVEAINEVIGAAASSGAPLHIVHLNSNCTKADIVECLQMVAGARARGLDVTTEAYPYIAGMTFINSALYNPGWQERGGVTYSDLMLPETGERLTQKRFDELHNSPKPQTVIDFYNTDDFVDTAITNPLVMIASDGVAGHPRNAGTFSRVLARYVRSQHSLTLMDAVRKMTLLPARRLEGSTIAAHALGRMQEGAAADVVVFDPNEIEDRATYSKPGEASVGVRYLIVNGKVVIDNASLVPNVYPGRALASRP